MDAGQCRFHERTLCQASVRWAGIGPSPLTPSLLHHIAPPFLAPRSAEQRWEDAPPTGRRVTEAQSLVTAKLNRKLSKLCEALRSSV